MKLIFSILLFLISIVFTLFMIQNFDTSVPSKYFDIYSLIFVIILILPFVIVGSANIIDLLNRAYLGSLFSGMIGFLVGIIHIFANLNELQDTLIGPAFAVSLLSFFYSIIFCVIFKLSIYFIEDKKE